MAMNQITFGFVKPDAYKYRKQIVDEFILPRLKIVGEKNPYYFTEDIAAQHYTAHADKPFFNALSNFTIYGLSGISSRHGARKREPTALYVLEGEDAIQFLTDITGHTDPGLAKWQANKSKTHTIRSKYGVGVPNNAFHRSDSPEAARREIGIHFRREELPTYVWEILETYPTSQL